jgi:hypothetical protein
LIWANDLDLKIWVHVLEKLCGMATNWTFWCLLIGDGHELHIHRTKSTQGNVPTRAMETGELVIEADGAHILKEIIPGAMEGLGPSSGEANPTSFALLCFVVGLHLLHRFAKSTSSHLDF